MHDIRLPAEPGAGRLGRDWLADYGDQCVCRHREWATLPPRLLAQLEDYVVPPTSPARFLHADLAIDHIFVEESGPAEILGIIDWGGAEATDPYYELPILHFDAFCGHGGLLRAFLDGYGWEVGDDFPARAMSAALRHESDVFDNLLAVRGDVDLERFETLDALAAAWWNPGS